MSSSRDAREAAGVREVAEAGGCVCCPLIEFQIS